MYRTDKVQSQRLTLTQRRTVIASWFFKVKEHGTEIEETSTSGFDRLRCAANLLMLVGLLTDDYLADEAAALHELVVNEIADREWAIAHKGQPPLPF